MSENTPGVTDLGAIQGTEGGPELPDLRTIPVTEVKPEDVGTLSLRYVDGVAQLVVSGGTVLPAGLTVVDGAGNNVASYTARPEVVGRSQVVFSTAEDNQGAVGLHDLSQWRR